MYVVTYGRKHECQRSFCRRTARAEITYEHMILDQVNDTLTEVVCLHHAMRRYAHKRRRGFAWWSRVVEVYGLRYKELSIR